MDIYSNIISILRWFPVISLSWYSAVKIPDYPIPPPDLPPHPNLPETKRQTERAHAPNQPPVRPRTITIVSVENDRNSAWASDSTAFGRKILSNMGWKEGYGIGKFWHGITTNLRSYCRPGNLSVGATTDLHQDSVWSKTNKNFGSILEALRRDHQGGTMG